MTAPEPPIPNPIPLSLPKRPRRRRSWRWRIGMTLLSLLVSTFVGQAIRGHFAQRAFEQAIADLKSSGQPILAADFAPPVLADGDNAAIDILAAAAHIDRDSDAWKAFENIELGQLALPLDPAEVSQIEAMLKQHALTLAVLEKFSKKRDAAWAVDPAQMSILQDVPGTAESRSLALLLANAALLAHQQQRDAQAIAHLRQMLNLSRAIDQQETFVAHLVSIGVAALAGEVAAAIAPDLRFEGTAAPHGAPLADLLALIDQLLDDADSQRGLFRAIARERYDTALLTRAIAEGTPLGNGAPGSSAVNRSLSKLKVNSWTARFLIKPNLYNDGVFAMRYYSGTLDALAKAQSLPAYRQAAPPSPDREIEQHPFRHFISGMMLVSVDRFLQAHYRGLTDRRLPALALCIAAYRAQHDGQRPQTLDQLIPEFLKAVPADPLAQPATPLRYLPGPAIVYSVGTNGTDDQGSSAPLNPRRHKFVPPERWEQEDWIVHLTRQPRRPKQEE